jgi:hypothetical protein
MAEFGFLGVVVKTRVQTPRFWGQLSKAGDLLLYRFRVRPFLTSWLTVGKTKTPHKQFIVIHPGAGLAISRRIEGY